MSRAVSSTVGVAALLAVTVAATAAVGAGALGLAPVEPAPRAAVELSVDADADRLILTLVAGEAVSVDAMTLHVTVDGTELAHQPPVPFFAATGFEPGPTGPFNVASDPTWSVGESASFALAGTNAPGIEQGSDVVVRVTVDGRTVAVVEAPAE